MNKMPLVPQDQLRAYNTWSQRILDEMLKCDSDEELNDAVRAILNQHPEWMEAFMYDYKHTVEFFDWK